MLALILLIVGVVSRFLIHIPNFTPVSALALFGGTYLPRKYALILPLLLMMITDSVIGFHDTIIFTWGSLLLTSILGFWLREHKNPFNIAACTLGAAVLFFIVTNFGTWLSTDLYPKTWDGLKNCFILAVPFFRATLASTIIYSAVFFGFYEVVVSRLRTSKFANAL